MNIDQALAAYSDMDKMGQAGVNIRIQALAENNWPAANELVIRAVQDELAGLPLPN